MVEETKAPVSLATQTFDYLVVIDFECTCEKDQRDYPHEVSFLCRAFVFAFAIPLMFSRLCLCVRPWLQIIGETTHAMSLLHGTF